jgi:sensor histidine kinase YesM
MRVLLYETENERYTLRKEIEFINDYIELMRYRLGENVSVSFNYPKIIPDVIIYPLLFISFVENAFKHGVKARGESFINVKMTIEDNFLIFTIENAIAANSINESVGIGLENARKRFELLYKNNYSFEVNNDGATFKVHLRIPLNIMD